MFDCFCTFSKLQIFQINIKNVHAEIFEAKHGLGYEVFKCIHTPGTGRENLLSKLKGMLTLFNEWFNNNNLNLNMYK